MAVAETHVACRLCGQEFVQLGMHLHHKHDTTAREYQRQFPGADVTAPALRHEMQERGYEQQGRWDVREGRPAPQWPRQRIIRAIQVWTDRTGSPPSHDAWQRATSTHPSGEKVKRVFGSWNRALIAAGVDAQPRHRRTHVDGRRCKRGHVIAGDNVKLVKGRGAYAGRVYATCKECQRTSARDWARKNYERRTIRA